MRGLAADARGRAIPACRRRYAESPGRASKNATAAAGKKTKTVSTDRPVCSNRAEHAFLGDRTMAGGQLGAALRHLRQLTDVQAAADLGDAELLRRFAGQRDPVAFEALVRRHGALVLRVCRQLLHDVHAA